MKELLKNINWKELLFPIWADIKSINDESGSATISHNNWDLANHNEDFEKVLKQIKESRSAEDSNNHDFIIIKD